MAASVYASHVAFVDCSFVRAPQARATGLVRAGADSKVVLVGCSAAPDIATYDSPLELSSSTIVVADSTIYAETRPILSLLQGFAIVAASTFIGDVAAEAESGVFLSSSTTVADVRASSSTTIIMIGGVRARSLQLMPVSHGLVQASTVHNSKQTTDSVSDYCRIPSEAVGAISVSGGGSVSLIDAVVSGHQVSAIAAYGPQTSVWVSNSSIANNTATHGGALLLMGSSQAVVDGTTTVANNSAMYGGGAFLVDTATLRVLGPSVVFSGNRAQLDGGAVFGALTGAVSASFTNNRASHGGGGAVYGSVFLDNTHFSNNDARYGPDVTDGPARLAMRRVPGVAGVRSPLRPLEVILVDSAGAAVLPYDTTAFAGMRRSIEDASVVASIIGGNCTLFGTPIMRLDAAGVANYSKLVSLAGVQGHYAMEFSYRLPSCDVFGTQERVLETSVAIELLACGLGSVFVHEDGVCQVCARGSFQNITSDTCDDCLDGTFSNETGLTACFVCPTGSESRGTGAQSCVACAKGRYLNGLSCEDCPDGTFANVSNLVGACLPCPTGHEPAGVGVQSCVACAAGSALSDKDGRCAPCPPGRFSQGIAKTTCEACADGETSVEGTMRCFACAVGTYSNATTNGTCWDCPPGQHTNSSSANSCLECLPGRYARAVRSSECIECPEGRFASEFAALACIKCPIGNFSSSAGASLCEEACVSGSSTSQEGSVDCFACAKGKFQNTTSRACQDCPDGTFADVASLTNCKACGAGQESGGVGAQRCTLCARGRFARVYGFCEDCPPGKFSNDTGLMRYFDCPNGTSAIQAASQSCTPCEIGRFSAAPGASNCTRCSRGRFSSVSGSALDCQMCPVGKVSAVLGSAECFSCDLGSIPSRDQSRCVKCPAGTFALRDVLNCTACTAGRFTGSSGLGACAECEAGKFSAANATACTACPRDTRAPSEGSTTCEPCRGSEYNDREGQRECRRCQSGTYRSATDCEPCPEGMLCVAGETQVLTGWFVVRDNATGRLSSTVCDPGRCTGNEQCGPNRQPYSRNPLCGRCVDGYYEWGGACVSCGEDTTGVWTGLVVLMWVFVLIYHAISQVTTGSLRIMVFFWQMAILFVGNRRWLDWLSVVNFDIISTSGSTCLGRLSPIDQQVLGLLLPLLSVALLGLTMLLHMAVLGCAGGAHTPAPRRQSLVIPRPYEPGADFALLKLSVLTRELHPSTYVRTLTCLYQYSFNIVVVSGLNFFNCIAVSDKSYVFTAPAIVCGTSEYKSVAVLAGFMLTLYLGIVPAMLGLKLLRLHRNHELEIARNRRFWGALYEPFSKKPFMHLWTLFSLARRITLVSQVVFVYEDERLKWGALIIASGAFLCLHMILQHYGDASDNHWEATTLFALLLLCAVLSIDPPQAVPAMLVFGMGFAVTARMVYIKANAVACSPRHAEPDKQKSPPNMDREHSILASRLSRHRPSVRELPDLVTSSSVIGEIQLTTLNDGGGEEKEKDDDEPKTPPLPADWEEFHTDDGVPYYHSPTANETVWERPR